MSIGEITVEALGKSVTVTGDEFDRYAQRVDKGVLGPVPDGDIVAANKFSRVPDEVLRLCQQLIDEHHHALRHARIGIVFRDGPWKSKGKEVWGTAEKVSDKWRLWGGDLDFLITLNEEVWRGRLTKLQRKALLDHELCHCEFDKNKLQASIRGHDVEEFRQIIQRYGSWRDDVKAMEEAFGYHEQLRLYLDDAPESKPRGAVVAVEPNGASASSEPRRQTNTDRWNDYRRNLLTPNGWRYDSPGCYVHTETGAQFHPDDSVTLDDGTVTTQWRVLASEDRAPDPNRSHLERRKSL